MDQYISNAKVGYTRVLFISVDWDILSSKLYLTKIVRFEDYRFIFLSY